MSQVACPRQLFTAFEDEDDSRVLKRSVPCPESRAGDSFFPRNTDTGCGFTSKQGFDHHRTE
jgi:hypothetical protein